MHNVNGSGFAYWTAYLAQGKHKANTRERPIQSTTKRVCRLPNGDIGLRLHATYCVIFHTDGTVTYDTGGWNTITTRKFINEHGPVRVFSDKGTLRLFGGTPTITPPKVSKCRKCHGNGRLPAQCYGPGWCYTSYWSQGQECEHGETVQHRRSECDHGQSEPHPLPDVECWRCHGNGRVDYGSKTVWPQWWGPYRFHPDTPDVEIAPAWAATKPTTAKPSADYTESGSILAQVMPATLSSVGYPCDCKTYMENSVQRVIIHLNDHDKWTREQIADWLDTIDLDLRFPVPK